jgi:uncharacterized protein with HEPN domain
VPFSDPRQAFKDILENIGRIERFTDGLDEDSFRAQEQTVFAVQYALLVISEAAIRLGEHAQQLAPEQPWRSIRGLGNWLRHGYDRIDPGVLWRAVIDDLPRLKAAAEEAVRSSPAPGPEPG